MELVFPFLAGIVYVAGALLLKRAADLGADVWRITRICNFTIAAFFLPTWFLGGSTSWNLLWQPAVAALLFVVGQVFSLLALKIGDVSVATPVLGLKILLVAMLTAMLLHETPAPSLWTAAILSSGAIALLNFNRGAAHHHVGRTIILASAAAAAYALFDVLVQKWSPNWGAGRFLPSMMFFVALFSCFLGTRAQKKPPLAKAAPWLAGGAACLGLQGMMFVTPIAIYGNATVANVLYSGRGLWSVLAVWLVGHWFGNRERHLGRSVLAWRFVGAVLLLAAILIVLFAPR
jgi:drug/metabolite transporter (DMT)-like permease